MRLSTPPLPSRRQRTHQPAGASVPHAYWSQTPEQVLAALQCTANGLAQADAETRLRQYGPNALQTHRQASALALLLSQYRSPLVIILILAAAVSAITGEWTDAAIVLAVVLGSTLLGFAQEFRAGSAIEKLRARVTLNASVLREGRPQSLPAERVVPGDVVLLSAGSLIPADGLVLEAKDFFVSQAVLTGETFPVEKSPGVVPEHAGLAERINGVFMGTSVRSGTARALIVQTGAATAFGQIAHRLSLRPPETEFERGIRQFGNLLTQVMTVMVLAVFAINVFVAKPPVDSLLFAIALAVGMTPELLPAIISVTLAHGAQKMAARGVIVRRLNAIENFGSMDVLCTDKTGTLTEGVVRLDGALDLAGNPSPSVLEMAYLNAVFQTGLSNPLDEAIIAGAKPAGLDHSTDTKLDEIPYDFVRKRLSVAVQHADGTTELITKGALEQVLAVCSQASVAGGAALLLDDAQRENIQRRFTAWSSQGFRVLGVASKLVSPAARCTRADERDLTFAGFLLFFDPPKARVQQTLANLARLGVQVKIITGDNRLVAGHVAELVGLQADALLTGGQLAELRDEALWHAAERTSVFAEVDPNEKERILLALRKTGHVVGYMGDGINDAPALHAADVGLSVDGAVDVAKEAADFILLRPDLDVLRQAIEEGRTTFANSLKYVFTTTSANFGNMLSMAGASALLPFLPLLAKQILLNNFLSDFPAVAIAADNVDRELVERPRRWDIRFIGKFMLAFGLISSVFDFLTFGLLLFVVRAPPALFRTGWFVESLLTELAVALVVRTRRPFFRSRPGRGLLLSTLAVVALTIALPYLPFSALLGFVPLPLSLVVMLAGITGLYAFATEVAKKYFYSTPR